jgi:aryl-alcohol dehydrogenase-like predicted oxidoreductase
MVGQALKSLGISRQQVVLATKAEHATGSGPNDGGASRYHLLNEVKASLKRLGTDHIDLYQLHGWDPATPVEATIRALDDMVRQGLVRYIGVSNWAAWQIAKALGTAERFQSVQAYYSLAGRDLEREVIPVAEFENLGLLVYSPLAGGYLTGKYRAGNAEGRRATVQFPPVDEQKGAGVLAAMDNVAKAHNTTLAAVALAWLRHQPAVTNIILGIKQPHQLDDNLKASELTLTNDDLQALDAASAPAPEYPGWMLAHGSAARQHLLISGQLAPQHG